MIERLQYVLGTGCDPHENLAIEQALLESTRAGCCTLYLWQNRNTVVIGRNQNAWKECRTALLEAEGGTLARRLSGGGAVYHDLGNLNFTFLLPSEDYDLDRQFAVIRTACALCGIETEQSGRNDLLADGRKFSGNAFYHHAGRSYHHGTLLVNVDRERMGRYLCPSKAKLNAKGVDSVRSRVVNLCELQPKLTLDQLKNALLEAFGTVYGLPIEPIASDAIPMDRVRELTQRNRSWEWNYGQRLPFDFACEQRFSWGELRVELQVENGIVRHASVFTDAMDDTLAPALGDALTGGRFDASALCERVRAGARSEAEDLCNLLLQSM